MPKYLYIDYNTLFVIGRRTIRRRDEPSAEAQGFRTLLLADAYRLTGSSTWRDVVRAALVGECFRFNVAFRLAGWAKAAAGVHARVVGLLARLWLRRLRRTLGINLPWATEVGPGLLIGHAGGIVINAAAVIGRDCNISHNVTIGVARGSRRPGVPTIGDRVYIGPGAVLIGAITIGDDAAIGANAVVTRDVPAGASAVGVPARVIAGGGSGDYVNRVSGPLPAQADHTPKAGPYGMLAARAADSREDGHRGVSPRC